MNAGAVKRWLEGLTLFMAKLVTLTLLPWSSRSESEKQNEDGPSWSLAPVANNDSPQWHTVPLTSQHRRRNSHSRNSFYPGRPVSHALLFFNVNIFNFSRASFPSNLIFAPLLPILLNYLQIQSSRTSMASVIRTLAYYLALATKFSFTGFAPQFEELMILCGSLALATLTSLALQLPWWSIFFIVLFMEGYFKLVNKLHATYGNTRRRSQPRMMQPILPFYNVMFNH